MKPDYEEQVTSPERQINDIEQEMRNQMNDQPTPRKSDVFNYNNTIEESKSSQTGRTFDLRKSFPSNAKSNNQADNTSNENNKKSIGFNSTFDQSKPPIEGGVTEIKNQSSLSSMNQTLDLTNVLP